MSSKTAAAKAVTMAAPEAPATPGPGEGALAGVQTAAPAALQALPPVAANCFDIKEQRNPGFWMCVPKGYTVAHLLEAGAWANVAGKMRPFSTVEVHWADCSQFAEFYVLDVGRTWALVDLMRHHVIGKAARPPATHQFEVGFNGPVDKWRVVNVTNNTVLAAGFASEFDAKRFLAEHMKKIG